MARKKDEAAEATEEKVTSGRGRKIMLTLPDGTEVARAEFIRDRFENGKANEDAHGPAYGATTPERSNRGHIAKELSSLQGKDIPYQIVFAATKTPKAEEESSDEAA